MDQTPAPPGLPGLAEARRQRDAAVASGDPGHVGYAEVVLGAALFEQHQPALALESFVRAEEAYLAAGRDDDALACRLNRARALSSLGRDEESVALYEAVAAASGPDDPAGGEALALHGLFEHHDRAGDHARADGVLVRQRELHVASGDRAALVQHDFVVAHRLFERGELAAAAASFAAVSRELAELGDTKQVGDCELYRGAAHYRADEHHQAEAAFAAAEAAYTPAGDQAGVESARQNLALVRIRD